MIVAYWALAGILAAAFLFAGGVKLVRPPAALSSMGLVWVEDFRPVTVKLIGAAEVAGAVGLILPMLTGILPVLSPIAALALAGLMAGAVVTHLRRKESFVPALGLGIGAAIAAVLGFLVL